MTQPVTNYTIAQDIDLILCNSEQGISKELEIFLAKVDGKTSPDNSAIFERVYQHQERFSDAKFLTEQEFHARVIQHVKHRSAQLQQVAQPDVFHHPRDYISHKALVELTCILYPKASKNGICYGFALVGTQAILSNDLPKFYLRLERLTALLNKYDNDYSMVIKQIQEDRDTDLLAFFENLHICMNGYEYSELFSEGKRPHNQADSSFLESILSLTASTKLAQQGSIIHEHLSTACYKEAELTQYLKNLETVLQAPPGLNSPVAFLIHSGGHAITLGYDPMQGTWSVIDANFAFCINGKDAETTARYIRAVLDFSEVDGDVPLHIDVLHTAGKKEWAVKKEQWESRPEIKEMHKIEGLSKKQRNALLWLAAACGDVSTVKALLKTSVDINQEGRTNNTPLSIAAENGHKEVVELLLAKGANINKGDKDGNTPLCMAAFSGQVEIVKLLLAKGAYVNKASKGGATPLMMAAQDGHVEVVKVLIAYGAVVNYTVNPTILPLWFIKKIVRPSVVEGAAVNHDPSVGITPLWVAASGGHIEVIKLLIANGARINQSDVNGVTPLLIAAQGGHVETIDYLLDNGAKIDKASYDGTKPLLIAIQNGHVEAASLLVKRGADIAQLKKDGAKLLRSAEERGQIRVVDFLLQMGITG